MIRRRGMWVEAKASRLFEIVDERKRNAGGGVLAEPGNGFVKNADVLCFDEDANRLSVMPTHVVHLVIPKAQ